MCTNIRLLKPPPILHKHTHAHVLQVHSLVAFFFKEKSVLNAPFFESISRTETTSTLHVSYMHAHLIIIETAPVAVPFSFFILTLNAPTPAPLRIIVVERGVHAYAPATPVPFSSVPLW